MIPDKIYYHENIQKIEMVKLTGKVLKHYKRMDKTKLIIFGTGIISDCLSPFFEESDSFDIIAYCVDKKFKKKIFLEVNQ